MKKEDVKIYDEANGLDGTIPELVDWCFHYDGDYTDEALEKISECARGLGFGPEMVRMPLLVKADRHRTAEQPDTLPLEAMQMDHLHGFKIYFSKKMKYGEVEIQEEDGKVLVSITGADSHGPFTAVNAYPMEDFMSGEDNWLESAVGETLYYGKTHENESQNDSPDEQSFVVLTEQIIQRYRVCLRNYFADNTVYGSLQKKGVVDECEWALENIFKMQHEDVRKLYDNEYWASRKAQM